MGVDTRVIDYPENAPYITVLHYISNPHLGPYVNPFSNTSNLNGPPHLPFGVPPPPPPMPGMSGLGGSDNQVRSSLLSTISSGGFKLKKVEPKEKMMDKVLKQNPSGLKVPSLADIQGALARLKRVDIDDV
jgi:hypothetical protein